MNEREYPEKPLVGVGALVLLDNKILLVKRGTPPGKFQWSVPGGLVESGETVREAVIRELKEETNLEGEPIKLMNIAEVIILDEKKRTRFHYILFDYYVKLIGSQKPKPSSDVVEAKFFTIEEALNLELTKPTRFLISKLKDESLCNCEINSFIIEDKKQIIK